jgi:5'-3' exonuclease
MGFLVGNDFIPHLPDLHISKGALPILYKVYMDVLPKVGGNFVLDTIILLVFKCENLRQ